MEDDFKLLSDAFLVPIVPVNHHKDANIRVHTFLCITGLLFYRYLACRCKHFRISLKRLVSAPAENKVKRGRLEMVVKEMDPTNFCIFRFTISQIPIAIDPTVSTSVLEYGRTSIGTA